MRFPNTQIAYVSPRVCSKPLFPRCFEGDAILTVINPLSRKSPLGMSLLGVHVRLNNLDRNAGRCVLVKVFERFDGVRYVPGIHRTAILSEL